MNEALRGTVFCNKCGTLNTVGAQFCSQCGASTSPMPGGIPTSASTSPYQGSPYSAPASYPLVAPVVAASYGGFWIRVVGPLLTPSSCGSWGLPVGCFSVASALLQ